MFEIGFGTNAKSEDVYSSKRFLQMKFLIGDWGY